MEVRALNKHIHICYLANAAHIHTVRWVNYFAEHGYKVDLITWHPPANDTSELHANITVHRIYFPPHYIARYGALLEITLLIKKIRPDIIHATNVNTFGILAGLYGRLSGFKPIVLVALGSDILVYAKRFGFTRWLTKYALKKADCVTCAGEHMVEELISLGTDSKKIKLIYFGTDIQKFNPEQRSEKLRENLGLLNSPSIISIRMLDPIYDVGSLITAIPLVLKEVPETKFVIVGRGSQEAKLKELAETLGVLGSIRFVGFIIHDELPRYLASSDIYVSTSLSDSGLAVSAAEAMACGLPVVITDFGDNSKWVEDGVNGFVVPLKDPKALAEKIIYLLKNEDERMKFGGRNRKIVEERSNYYTEMKKMEKIYEELIVKYKP